MPAQSPLRSIVLGQPRRTASWLSTTPAWEATVRLRTTPRTPTRSPTTSAATVVSANNTPCVAERPGASDHQAEAITSRWSATSSTAVSPEIAGRRRASTTITAITPTCSPTKAALTRASSMYWPLSGGLMRLRSVYTGPRPRANNQATVTTRPTGSPKEPMGDAGDALASAGRFTGS